LFVDLRYSPKYFFRSYNLPLGQKPSKEKKTFFMFPVKKQFNVFTILIQTTNVGE
jgi:hypothetical protein